MYTKYLCLPNILIFLSLQGTRTFNILNPPERCGADNYKWGHLAMTYTSIAILVILGDDLSRLDRKAIIEGKTLARFHEHFNIFGICNFQVLKQCNDQTAVSAPP